MARLGVRCAAQQRRRLRGGKAGNAAVVGAALAVAFLMGTGGCAKHIGRTELAAAIAAGSPPPILDVRSRGEFEASHVPGAVHIPFYSVVSRSDDLPVREGEPLVVYCEHGPRAGLARAGLWWAGAGEVRFLEGHMTGWKADGLPVERVESKPEQLPSPTAAPAEPSP